MSVQTEQALAKQEASDVRRIPLNQIDFGTRFRHEFDDSKQEELVESIRAHGQISSIAVVDKRLLDYEPNQATDDEKPFLLLAGERRCRAFNTLGLEEIDAKIYEEILPPWELRKIELVENIHREDLSWQEEVALKKEIHELEVGIAGEKIGPNSKGHSLRDTAKLLGVSPATVSLDLKLADAMQTMPELAEEKDKKSAHKKLERYKKELAMAELARRQKARQASTPQEKLKKDLADSYILMDFFKGVKQVPAKAIDFVEIDPPYGIDLNKVKREDASGYNATEHYNEIDQMEYLGFLERAFHECYRVMKEHSWGVCWFGPDPWFEHVYQAIEGAGFTVKRMPLIWAKGSGQTNQPSYNLGNAYEMAFYFRKGQATLNKQGRSNVFSYTPVHHEKKQHPTERPIALIEDLIETFCTPGSRILTPFAGSGKTIMAASNKGMSAFGYDLSEQYKNAYDTRIYHGIPGEYTD